MERILPSIIMVEMFIASVPCIISGKYGSALYWAAAGLINLAVIFVLPKFG